MLLIYITGKKKEISNEFVDDYSLLFLLPMKSQLHIFSHQYFFNHYYAFNRLSRTIFTVNVFQRFSSL